MAEPSSTISIRGAAEHNLQEVDIDIPRNRLVVVTGLSGSGKSSLAFDTIYAEGQRKYVESLSAYARQFLDQLQKPKVESIEGLPPTIAIEQPRARPSPPPPRSTTISGCSTPGSAVPAAGTLMTTVRCAENRLRVSRPRKLLIRSARHRRAPG